MFAPSLGSEQNIGAIHVVPEAGGTIVAVCLEGEFDVANVSALRDQVDDTLASGSDLILDLSRATFIDSSVIHVLVGAGHAVNGKNQSVVLQLGTAPTVERALKLAPVESALPHAHDRGEAVRMIERRAATV